MIHSTSKKNRLGPTEKGIVFFDDDCLLCNKTVYFLLKRDKHKVLQFAPIRGFTFNSLNLNLISSNKNSVIFLKNGEIALRSNAILKILYQLPLPWKLTIILFVIPKPIRDFFYRYIAENRVKFFGKNNMCITNDADHADSFLK